MKLLHRILDMKRKRSAKLHKNKLLKLLKNHYPSSRNSWKVNMLLIFIMFIIFVSVYLLITNDVSDEDRNAMLESEDW